MPTVQMREDASLRHVLEALPVPYLNYTETNAARGHAFEALLLQWFQTDRTMTQLYKTVEPWETWARTQGLETEDLGIDLVLTTASGAYVAVQAKCYAASRQVATGEIDSFLARALGVRETHGAGTMLVCTTDRVAGNGMKKLANAGTTLVGHSDLEASDVRWGELYNAVFANGEPPAPARPRELYDYQSKAVTDVVSELSRTDRTQLIAACGTGKTLMALRTAEALDANNLVVFAAPSIALVAQTARSWLVDSKRPFQSLVVCSDQTAGQGLGNNSKAVDQEILQRLPVSVTTEADTIAAFLDTPGTKYVFTTHVSASRVQEAMAAAGHTADMLVVDEAHRIAGRSQAGPVLCTGLPARKRLFATATPRVLVGAAANGDRRYTSMDNEELFGIEAHNLSFADAVELKALVDYRIRILTITDADVQAALTNNSSVGLDDGLELTPEELVTHIALQRYKDDGIQRVVSYHSSKRTARAFAANYNAIAQRYGRESTHRASVLTGEDSVAERHKELVRLEHLEAPDGTAIEQSVIANIHTLVEGVDCSAIDSVLFADRKRSTTAIVQAVGRAMRLSPDTGKAEATVILPVLVQDGEDPTAGWEDVVAVLRAMCSADGRLIDAIEAAQRDRLRGGLGSGGKGQSALGQFISIDSATLAGLEDAATLAVLDRTVGNWHSRYAALQQHVAAHGFCLTGRADLSDWCTNQRTAHRKGKLEQSRVTLLEALPEWVWDPREQAWQTQFAELRKLVETEGRVPSRGWSNNQRTAYRERSLSPERIALLEAVPGWSWDARELVWQTQFAQLQEETKSGEHIHFTGWNGHQRAAYRKGSLSSERIALLETVPGWSWGRHASPRDQAA